MGYLRKMRDQQSDPHIFIHMNPFPEILDPPLHLLPKLKKTAKIEKNEDDL